MSAPADNKKQHIIELIDVSKDFDGVSVVENLNFYIRKGRISVRKKTRSRTPSLFLCFLLMKKYIMRILFF